MNRKINRLIRIEGRLNIRKQDGNEEKHYDQVNTARDDALRFGSRKEMDVGKHFVTIVVIVSTYINFDSFLQRSKPERFDLINIPFIRGIIL